VLSDINKIVASVGVNISSQYLSTRNEIGYLIMDVEQDLSRVVKQEIESLSANIRTRLLY
jgi:D-3-phosphoglycerate dehydrogenase